MGCLSASLSRSGGIGAHLSNMCGVDARAERVGGIKVRFGLICSVNYARKLEVSKEYLWLLPENFFQDSFAIITEVEWHII